MPRFLVNMARLYELFVAEWLKAHLPRWWLLKAQEKVSISLQTGLHFDIDLVLYDAVTGRACCVLDTKYKAAPHPDPADIAQVVAYAEAKGCNEALLVYPWQVPSPLDEKIGRISVRSSVFPLDGDIEWAGRQFLDRLLAQTS